MGLANREADEENLSPLVLLGNMVTSGPQSCGMAG